jgi:hypothetical protein
VVRAHPTVPHKILKSLLFMREANAVIRIGLSKGSTKVPKAPRVVSGGSEQLILFGYRSRHAPAIGAQTAIRQ